MFLEEIADVVSPDHPAVSPRYETVREHEEQRSNLAQYSLKDIIEEYEVLQDVIFEVLQESGDLPNEVRDQIFHSIVRGISGACVEYSRIHDSIREQFVAILTHDLKNPLSAAKTSTQMIARSLQDPEKCETFAHRALNSIRRIEVMLADLLDTFQIRAGKPFRSTLDRMIYDEWRRTRWRN